MEGEVLGILAFTLGGIAWMFVPFWEMKIRREKRPRPLTVIGVLVVLYIVGMTIWGYLV
jgi:cytochrome b6